MRFIYLTILILLLGKNSVFAQDKLPPLDKSQMDMSYYPPNYPMLKVQSNTKEPLIARIIYSRPSKNGRKIFGELLEYGKVWRVGANEATEIEFFKDVFINKTKIKKGRYSLYAIPSITKWSIMINKETDTWGAFTYDSKKDVIKTDVLADTTQEITESCTVFFEKNEKAINLNIMWDNVKVALPFYLNKN
jgi:hypothetical protein